MINDHSEDSEGKEHACKDIFKQAEVHNETVIWSHLGYLIGSLNIL